MSVKLLTEHNLEFLSLKGRCTGLFESTLVKMPHCWKSHVMAQLWSMYVFKVPPTDKVIWKWGHGINRGSTMSAHVLLNLLNKSRKRDKMLGKPRILSLFLNLFNKFNNTGAGTLDSIYHMTLKSFWNNIFGVKTLGFYHMCDVKSVIS